MYVSFSSEHLHFLALSSKIQMSVAIAIGKLAAVAGWKLVTSS